MRIIRFVTITATLLLSACNSIPHQEQQTLSAESLYYKGIQYLSGENVPKNEAKALEYFKISSKKGYAPADNALAVIYDEGIAVEQNHDLALEYYEKAANNHHVSAQYNLAVYYYEHDPKNPKLQKYLSQAISNNDSDALNLSAKIALKEGKNTEAYQIFSKSASQNNPTALFYLYLMKLDGIGTYKNNHEAINFLKKSANLNQPDALFTLGSRYLTGDLVEKNPTKAFQLFEKADALGHIKATSNLAIMHAKGEGTSQNPEKALKLFKKAAQKGDNTAIEALNSLQS